MNQRIGRPCRGRALGQPAARIVVALTVAIVLSLVAVYPAAAGPNKRFGKSSAASTSPTASGGILNPRTIEVRLKIRTAEPLVAVTYSIVCHKRGETKERFRDGAFDSHGSSVMRIPQPYKRASKCVVNVTGNVQGSVPARLELSAKTSAR